MVSFRICDGFPRQIPPRRRDGLADLAVAFTDPAQFLVLPARAPGQLCANGDPVGPA